MRCVICLNNFSKCKFDFKDQTSIEMLYFRSFIDSNKMCQLCADMINLDNLFESCQNLCQISKQAYDKIIDLNPKDLTNYVNKSCITFMLGDFKHTIEICNMVLAIEPLNYPACLNKGIAFKSLEMYSESIEWLEKAISIMPECLNNYEILASVCLKANKFENAITFSDKCIKSGSSLFIESYYYKGEALFNMKLYQEAIVCLDKGIQIFFNDPRFHFLKGNGLNYFSSKFDKIYKFIIKNTWFGLNTY